ncbi:MAG: hypothetical protein U0996_22270 [Planctomycetaceae bacterium]
MDKLQPLIKHRYWICFGLSVIFVIVGWWMASGAIATEIENGRKAVDGAFSKAKQGANDPNAKWVEAADERNKQDTAAFTAASTELRERQQNARQWPEAVRDEMKGIPYQGPITNQISREKWASVYKDEIDSLLQIVKPFENGEGLVVVTSDRITHKPFEKWKFGPPQSKEIWDSQEDIWLLRSLLTSIASVNGDATRITEASVREIQRLWLRGGDPAATPSAAGGAGGMGGMGGGMSGMGEGMMSGNTGGMSLGGDPSASGSGGGAAAGASFPGKEFEGTSGGDILAEEFGADSSNAGLGGGGALGGGGGGGIMGSAPAGKGSFASDMMGGGMMGGGESAAASTEEKRYVHEVEGSYKTRAFLLDVMVRDDKLPELLAALTDSDFPVEIVRVEINATPGAGGAAPGGMGGMSTMSGMGGSSMEDPGPGLAPSSGMGMGAGMGLSGAGGMGMGMGGGKGMMPPAGGPGMGLGLGPGMAGGAFGAGGGMGSPTGMEALQIAMSDPLLISVRIGGLMTLYQSAQESDAAEQSEAAAATEVTPPPVTPENGGAPSTAPTDGTTPAPGAAPGDTTTPAPSENGGAPTPADGAAPADANGTGTENPAAPGAAPGTAPAEPGSPAADPANPGTPAGQEPNPADPAPAPAPAGTATPGGENPAPAGDGASPAPMPAAPGSNAPAPG